MPEDPHPLSEFFAISPEKCRDYFPGTWTVVPPDPDDSKVGLLVSRRGDDLLHDCVPEFTWDRDGLWVATIFEPRLEWQGHELSVLPGRRRRVISFSTPLADTELRALSEAITASADKARSKWKLCALCGHRYPPASMHEQKACMGCAERVWGVVY